MLSAQIALARQTWGLLEPCAAQTAAAFYSRLFDLDPQLRSLFNTDMDEQGDKFMRLLGTALRGLEHPEVLRPALHDLGRRHAAFGVRAEDYATVAVALLWAIEQSLGAAFTSDVRMAWTEVYMLLATMMQGA